MINRNRSCLLSEMAWKMTVPTLAILRLVCIVTLRSNHGYLGEERVGDCETVVFPQLLLGMFVFAAYKVFRIPSPDSLCPFPPPSSSAFTSPFFPPLFYDELSSGCLDNDRPCQGMYRLTLKLAVVK